MEAPARKQGKQVKQPKPRQDTLANSLSLTRHHLLVRDDSYHCSVCLDRVHRPSHTVRKFLEGPSSPCSPNTVRNMPILVLGQIRIANQTTHASHCLNSFRGLIFCTTCGGVAASKMRKLGEVCAGELSAFGKNSLDRISRGLPPHHAQWPDSPAHSLGVDRFLANLKINAVTFAERTVGRLSPAQVPFSGRPIDLVSIASECSPGT